MNRIAQRSGRSSTGHLLTAVAAILLIACGKKAADTSGAGSVATDNPAGESNLASGAGRNPCGLLESKEVEAILGVTLAGPPYRFNKTGKEGPAPDGEACRYETTSYHVVEVEVDWTGGAQMMKMHGAVQKLADQHMKGVLKLANGSQLTGGWDEAKVVTCCTFIALHGDQAVTVDVSGSNATLEQAAKMADAALKRIDQPLPIDPAEGIAAAMARAAARPAERSPCSLVSRAEAEAALGTTLATDPVVDGSKCDYTSSERFVGAISLGVSWRNGYAQFRQHVATAADVGKAFEPGADASQQTAQPVAADSLLVGPWDSAQVVQDQFYAVKKDVLITAGSVMGRKQQEHARNLVAAAMSKF
ncbi:MAG: hypothetical protein ABIP73_00180 [Gemmatimonadaceae bacterium]